MMDKKKQQALFEVQLFLPYEIKADKLKRDVTVSLPASEEPPASLVGYYFCAERKKRRNQTVPASPWWTI